MSFQRAGKNETELITGLLIGLVSCICTQITCKYFLYHMDFLCVSMPKGLWGKLDIPKVLKNLFSLGNAEVNPWISLLNQIFCSKMNLFLSYIFSVKLSAGYSSFILRLNWKISGKSNGCIIWGRINEFWWVFYY